MKKLFLRITVCVSLFTLVACNYQSNDGNTEMIDVNEIMMTVPTIDNYLPSTTTQEKETLYLEILEDDWRQIEFVHSSFRAIIKQELDSIDNIIENESVGKNGSITGFKSLYVRKRIPKPLQEGIDLNDFREEFSAIETGSLSFYQYGRVKNGVFFDVSKVQLYGVYEESKITALGLYGLSTWDNIKTFHTEINNFMTKYGLLLVDWRSGKVVEAGEMNKYLVPSE